MDTSEQYEKGIVNPLEPLEKVEYVKWYDDPIYIKMCEKAEEIQRGRLASTQDIEDCGASSKWENGDFYTCVVSGGRRFTAAWTDTEDAPPAMFNPIWLPLQHQLQEMIPFEGVDGFQAIGRAIRFAEWIRSDNAPMGQWWSMEELWLAFVMKEKYGKVWNGEGWEAEYFTPS